MNQEGYRDPTADKAVRNASRMPRHVRNVYNKLEAVAGLCGFEIIGLRDRRTGREYTEKEYRR